MSAEARAGTATQIVEQVVLEPAVTDGGMRLDPALVIPVAARGARVGILQAATVADVDEDPTMLSIRLIVSPRESATP